MRLQNVDNGAIDIVYVEVSVGVCIDCVNKLKKDTKIPTEEPIQQSLSYYKQMVDELRGENSGLRYALDAIGKWPPICTCKDVISQIRKGGETE